MSVNPKKNKNSKHVFWDWPRLPVLSKTESAVIYHRLKPFLAMFSCYLPLIYTTKAKFISECVDKFFELQNNLLKPFKFQEKGLLSLSKHHSYKAKVVPELSKQWKHGSDQNYEKGGLEKIVYCDAAQAALRTHRKTCEPYRRLSGVNQLTL